MDQIKGRKRDTIIDKKIGARLRLLRMQRELTQEQLGKQLGITFQQIQKYENGTNAIASTRIPRLCEILRIKPDDLFSGFALNAPAPVTSGAFALGLAVRIEKAGTASRRTFTAFVDLIERMNNGKG